jgi:hypothetical protein
VCGVTTGHVTTSHVFGKGKQKECHTRTMKGLLNIVLVAYFRLISKSEIHKIFKFQASESFFLLQKVDIGF